MSTCDGDNEAFASPDRGNSENEVLDQIIVDDEHNPRWPIIPSDGLPPLSPTHSAEDKMPYSNILSGRFVPAEDVYSGAPSIFGGEDALSQQGLFPPKLLDPPGLQDGAFDTACKTETPIFETSASLSSTLHYEQGASATAGPVKMNEDASGEFQFASKDASSSKSSSTDPEGMSAVTMDSGINEFIKTPFNNEYYDSAPQKKKVQKPPTTAGITLDNLKAVFGLERPEAEKRLGLKRTTFSNLSRYYGISKWPFRTIRDATNRKQANEIALRDKNLSKEKRKKLLRQQMNLQGVINLMYSDPSQSKDSNTLAVLMNIVSSREEGNY